RTRRLATKAAADAIHRLSKLSRHGRDIGQREEIAAVLAGADRNDILAMGRLLPSFVLPDLDRRPWPRPRRQAGCGRYLAGRPGIYFVAQQDKAGRIPLR